MSRPSINELNSLAQRDGTKLKLPNVVIDVFKNRRGRWSQVRIWGQNDLGCCRRKDLFLTDANLNPINNFSVVNFKEEQRSELPEFSQDDIISLEDLSTQETVEEAFGETKKRMKNVSFADLI